MRTLFASAITLLIVVLMVGCATAPTPLPPTLTPIPSTATPVPPIATLIPSTATPLPTKPPPTPQFSAIKESVTDAELRCIEGAIGVQATADLQQRKRFATNDELSAIDKCRTGQDNPRNHEVYVTTSADGLNWAPPALLSKTASVPGVVRTSKGILWVYWVDFADLTGPNRARIGVAKSSDGNIWERMGFVEFTGLGQIAAADPDVIELDDGRLRMYVSDGNPAQGNQHSIYSAISTNGINYALEPSVRFQAENITDPNVIRLKDGRYRMYLNRNGDITSATSADGLTFTDDGGTRLPTGNVPGAIVLPDGTVRLYHCGNGISVSKSGDGLAFALEKEGVIRAAPGTTVCDPSVTAMPTGYLMVYKFSPTGPQPPPGQGQQLPPPPTGTSQPKPLGTPIIPSLVPGPVRECIEQKIGVQARMDIQQGTRAALPAEKSAIQECMAPAPVVTPIVTPIIPSLVPGPVRECIEQKIGVQARMDIQLGTRAATPAEESAIRDCLGQLPPPPAGAPPSGCSACQPMPSGVGAMVVINHFGQDATFTLSGIAGKTMHLAKDGGNEQWNMPPGRYTFSANVPGTKIDCSKYNGCTLEITLGKWTVIDLW